MTTRNTIRDGEAVPMPRDGSLPPGFKPSTHSPRIKGATPVIAPDGTEGELVPPGPMLAALLLAALTADTDSDTVN